MSFKRFAARRGKPKEVHCDTRFTKVSRPSSRTQRRQLHKTAGTELRTSYFCAPWATYCSPKNKWQQCLQKTVLNSRPITALSCSKLIIKEKQFWTKGQSNCDFCKEFMALITCYKFMYTILHMHYEVIRGNNHDV